MFDFHGQKNPTAPGRRYPAKPRAAVLSPPRVSSLAASCAKQIIPLLPVLAFVAPLLAGALLSPAGAQAATIHVGPSATGSGNGSDWNNRAGWGSLTFARGNTYYLAGGSYSARTFSTSASGSTLITIKKAVASDHGSDTGWSSALGEGQAVFTSGLTFTTQYWVLDGQVRTSPKSGHGIKIEALSNSDKGLTITGSGNLTFRYIEVEGDGGDGTGHGNDAIYSAGAESNITISYCHLHDMGRTHILSRGGSNWVLEYSVLARNESTSGEHSESWSNGGNRNVIVRYNLFQDVIGTGIFSVPVDSSPDNWDIYGNVFLNFETSNGAITTDTTKHWTNSRVYNNTFIGGTGYNSGVTPGSGSGSGWLVYNNIWYNCSTVGFNTPHDYNWFYGSGGNSGEAHGQAGAGNPFVNLSNGDVHLTAPTNPGIALASPYNLDPDGNIRGGTGGWTRGAFQYGGSQPVPAAAPAAPSNIVVR